MSHPTVEVDGVVEHPTVEVDGVVEIFSHNEKLKDLRAVYGLNTYLVDTASNRKVLAETYILETGHHYQLKRGSTTSTATANEGRIETEVNENRKRRWNELNKILDINKKAKKTIREDGLPSVGYSYVSWDQVKHLFEVTQGSVVSSSTAHTIADEMLDALLNYLSLASVCFGSITEGHEAKRVHFIAPVIIIVCASFNGDIQILAEEDIDGNRVHAHGHFEFVLKRGDKRVCIVEAKKDDILQGKTQSLVGCESLSDVENLDTVYGIATNYLEWCFLKNEADSVTEEILTVELEDNKPTKRSLEKIANKICSILV